MTSIDIAVRLIPCFIFSFSTVFYLIICILEAVCKLKLLLHWQSVVEFNFSFVAFFLQLVLVVIMLPRIIAINILQ